MSATLNMSGIAERYASALYDLADDQRMIDGVANDLAGLNSALAASPDFQTLIRSPLISREDQARAIEAILAKGGASDLIRRFLLVVVDHRRLPALPAIIAAFQKILADRRGHVSATVTSAQPLSSTQLSALRSAFKEGLGRDVDMETHVDESLI
ncbi:MAG: ATP synthase F1 subunit delta, partial [Pseudomonadota bacterium]